MNQWWAPGQSTAVKEICQHLNGKEKAQLRLLGFAFGLCCFAIPALFLFSFMGLGLFEGIPANPGFALCVLACLMMAAWLLIRQQRALLLGNQFARDKGFTLTDIMAREPLSRGDYLKGGGIAVLALMICVAAALISIGLFALKA